MRTKRGRGDSRNQFVQKDELEERLVTGLESPPLSRLSCTQRARGDMRCTDLLFLIIDHSFHVHVSNVWMVCEIVC